MTNEEKKEYLSIKELKSNTYSFTYEINRKKDLLKSIPRKLYKYRPFDKFAFKMIKEEYIRFSPIDGLDDPFDCLVVEENESKLTVEEVLKRYKTLLATCTYKKYNDIFSLEVYKQIIDFIISHECFDTNLSYLQENFKICKSKATNIINYINVININFLHFKSDLLTDYEYIREQFMKLDKLGVVCLAEENDNKLMWSLYSDGYEGYCIEYEIPNDIKIINKLYPVVYGENFTNNLLDKVIAYNIGLFERNALDIFDNYCSENLGSLNALLCQKDSIWAFQKEWRFFGESKKHFQDIKIKAIYLGYKIEKNNKDEIIKCSKDNNFDVYLMKHPGNDKKLSFEKLCDGGIYNGNSN